MSLIIKNALDLPNDIQTINPIFRKERKALLFQVRYIGKDCALSDTMIIFRINGYAPRLHFYPEQKPTHSILHKIPIYTNNSLYHTEYYSTK